MKNDNFYIVKLFSEFRFAFVLASYIIKMFIILYVLMVTQKVEIVSVPEAGDESNFSLTHILLIIIVLLNASALYLLTGNSISLPASMSVDPIGVKKALLEIEYSKVGGKENYDIMTQAQNLSVNDPQNPSNIEAMKKYIATYAS